MAINFPDSPSLNDTHTVNGKTWAWDGNVWKLTGSSNRGISLQLGDTPPTDPVQGDMWYETDTGRTFTYYDGTWVELGNTAVVSAFLSDSDGDTMVHVEESADEDIIRFDTAGVERATVAADGTVTVFGSTVLQGGASVGAAIIPTSNETYDLGSAEFRFRDLYLSGSSIDLGGVSISSDGTNLSLPPISSVSGDFTVDTDTLHVDSTNNRVGIGTATPSSELDIVGNISVTGTASSRIDLIGGDARVYLEAESGIDGDLARLQAYDNVTENFIPIIVGASSVEMNNVTVYSGLTVPSGDFTVDTDTLHVDTTNNRVGIGTTTPSSPLHIKADSFDMLSLDRTDNANVDQQVILTPTYSGSGNTAFAIKIGGEIMRVTEAGNVGIGDTSPSYKLDVEGQVQVGAGDDITPDASGNGHLMVDGNGYSGFVSLDGTAMWVGQNSGFRKLYLATDDTARVTVDGSGNVGIGTTTPVHPLHVTGSDNRPIRAQSTVSGSYIDIQDSTTTGEGYVGIGAVGDILHLIAGGTQRLTIDASGNVGIGTTTPASSAPYENYKLTFMDGGFYTWETMSMINGFARVTADAAKPDTPGLLLNNAGANTVNWSTPGLWFTSTDSAFTTESPKYLAGLVGRATSTYNDNNDAGMQISMYLSGNNAGNGFLSTTAYGYQFGAGALHPFSDNTASLGITGYRWSVVYAASGSINTSDVRDKTDIDDLDYGLDFVNSLRPVKYRYADRDSEVEGVRTHMGFIAQEVETVLGDDAPNRGLWTSSQFEKTDFLDEDENPVYSDVDRQGLRYEEMIAPMVKAIQELTARIEALEVN